MAPVTQAGANATITLPLDSVLLSGTANDTDGTIAGMNWTKISGPAGFAIDSPAQAQTLVRNLTAGVYEFQFEVTDNAGAIGRDTVKITVNPATPGNIAPVVFA